MPKWFDVIRKAFAPKWRHEDPLVRRKAAAELAILAPLKHLALNDDDESVRATACGRLLELESHAVSTFTSQRVDASSELFQLIEFVENQPAIAVLAESARNDNVQTLAIKRCSNVSVLHRIADTDGNGPTCTAAMYRLWFLAECEAHRCSQQQLTQLLESGPNLRTPGVESLSRCLRTIRSVRIVGATTESEHAYSGAVHWTRTETTTSYDLGDFRDHVVWREDGNAVRDSDIWKKVRADRALRDRGSPPFVLIDHHEYNEWLLKLIPNKNHVPLDFSKAIIEPLSEYRPRALRWLHAHLVPLQYFLEYRRQSVEAYERFRISQRSAPRPSL